MIELEHVHALYPGSASPVVEDVNLHIPRDETLVLLGGSGAGKSTLLRLIMRLIPITGGSIRVDGEDIAGLDPVALRRMIGMVFQQTSLFPHLTVEENIALPLRVTGVAVKERRARSRELLEMVALDPALYSERYPHTLSGGQQQRVGVARALATRPSYLLMDEPFGALDALTRRSLQEELKSLRRRLGITILFVTHDVMEAVSLGDRIAVMEAGHILQVGSAAALMRAPTHAAVRELVVTPLEELKHFVQESVR